MVQLTLYTRAQCPLCHEMRAVIERVARDEVPVLAINGRKAFAVRVDAGTLRARLAER